MSVRAIQRVVNVYAPETNWMAEASIKYNKLNFATYSTLYIHFADPLLRRIDKEIRGMIYDLFHGNSTMKLAGLK